MESKTIRKFQVACNAVGPFGLADVQRHYRVWKQSSESVEEYIANHQPQPDDILLFNLCRSLSYDSSGKAVQSLKKDGIEIRDTLSGLYVSQSESERIKSFLTAYKPLKALFDAEMESVSATNNRASFNDFCRLNSESRLFLKLYCRSSKGEFFYLDAEENKVRDSIRLWLDSEDDTASHDAASQKKEAKNKGTKSSKKIRSDALFAESESDYIGLNYIAAEIVEETGSAFDYKKNGVDYRCRDKLHRFIESNEVWGIDAFSAEDLPEINKGIDTYYFRKEDVDAIKRHLRLWISAFGKSDAEKLILLFEHKSKEIPETIKLLTSYYTDSNRKETDSCAKDTVDFFLSILPAEVRKLTEHEIQETIIIPFVENMRVINQESIARFLYKSRLTKRQYTFEPRGKHEIDISAYPLESFGIMQYITMGREQIEKRDLIKKAVKNKRFADAWLFVICHFFAAWRSTDFVRLPVPPLPYSAEETLERLRNGVFSTEEAEKIASYEIAMVASKELRPSKTRTSSNIPQLQLYVPPQQRCIFGLVLAIETVHYLLNTDEPTLVKKVNDIYTLSRFFGQDFVDACDGRNFSTRRANKAMLQSLSSTSTEAMSYLLPSVVRNHKTEYGKMAPTTAIYLQDNNFSGVTPQFVIEQMGARGFCGFLKQILLETAFGEDYKKLPIKIQTSLVSQVGLTAFQIDGVEEIVEQAEKIAAKAVAELLWDCENKQEAARGVLLRLIDGKGKGKSGTCVMLAAGKPCIDIARQNCIGCPYELLEIKMILILKREFDRATRALDDEKIKANPVEAGRQKYLLDEVIIPGIAEICATVKDYSSKQELETLLELAEKGLDDAAS